MRQYFFDVVGKKTRQHDYAGRLFSTADHAKSYAELVALDIGMRCMDDWNGLQVKCYDPYGTIVHSVDIVNAA